MAHYNAPLAASLVSIRQKPRKKKWEVVLEVHEEIGQRIMDFAQMLAGLTRWDESKFLQGGLALHDSVCECGCES